MINFKDLSILEIQKYIGKKIYIVHPGIGKDKYWGEIDSEPAHLIFKVIDEIHISTLGVEIITIDGDEYNIDSWKIFCDKRSAINELKK